MRGLNHKQKEFLHKVLQGHPFKECLSNIEELIADGLMDPKIGVSKSLIDLQTMVANLNTAQRYLLLEDLFNGWGWHIE